jgi:hypothetical protein
MEMMKFEIEVLNEYSYGQLMNTNAQLTKAKKFLSEAKEEAMKMGMYKIAVDFEAQLIRIRENLDSIGIVMMSKETDCFDLTGRYESMCLN